MVLLEILLASISEHYEPLLHHQKGRGSADGTTTAKQAHLDC